MQKTDITGKRYGKLIAIKRVGSIGNTSLWLCQCDCGKSHTVRLSNLTSGNTKSCGCLKNEQLLTSGSAYEKLYKSWLRMKQRCFDKNTKDYKNYGGRGITVCDEWIHDYENFRNWAYSNGYDDTLSGLKCSLDRIDVNGNYEPNNCRWVDVKVQMNNTRSNHYIVLNGEKRTVQQWSEVTGISRSTINRRINSGFNPEEILKPTKNARRKIG